MPECTHWAAAIQEGVGGEWVGRDGEKRVRGTGHIQWAIFTIQGHERASANMKESRQIKQVGTVIAPVSRSSSHDSSSHSSHMLLLHNKTINLQA